MNEGARAIHAFIRYERGAMTDDTRGRRAKPYAAAPRNVAVSASGGRAITLIREPNWLYKKNKVKGENAMQNGNVHALAL